MNNFKSKKFVVALIYFAIELTVSSNLITVPRESLEGLRTVIIAYLTGQSFVDSVLVWKSGKKDL